MFSIRKINKKFVRSARSKHSSILMAAYSIGIQIINFSLLPLAVFIHESVLISALIKIMAMLCFFTLLFGILGIVYGFMYLLLLRYFYLSHYWNTVELYFVDIFCSSLFYIRNCWRKRLKIHSKLTFSKGDRL